jgi:hypothetical protein
MPGFFPRPFRYYLSLIVYNHSEHRGLLWGRSH